MNSRLHRLSMESRKPGPPSRYALRRARQDLVCVSRRRSRLEPATLGFVSHLSVNGRARDTRARPGSMKTTSSCARESAA